MVYTHSERIGIGENVMNMHDIKALIRASLQLDTAAMKALKEYARVEHMTLEEALDQAVERYTTRSVYVL